MDSINIVLSKIFADQTGVLLIVGALLLLMGETGYRAGRRVRERRGEPQVKRSEGVQAAVLGLLGLLLGFTFAMALQRFDQRQQLAQSEANAIGTAFLRASFLPPPGREASEALFRKYLELRIGLLKATASPAALAAHEASAADIQRQLWAIAVHSGHETPNALIASYAQALNEMIDMDASRLASLRRNVPGAAWLLLLLVASLGCWTSGYIAGGTGRRLILSQIALPLLITIVITLVADLDRARFGLIGVDEKGLHDLRRTLNTFPRQSNHESRPFMGE